MKVAYHIRGDVNDLSPNKRFHWRTRHALEKQWQQRAALEWAASPRPLFFPGRVRVSFYIHRGRALDACNAHGSRALKALVDGLKGRLFTDDSPRYLEWGEVAQYPDKRYREHPYVLVLVEEIGPESAGGADTPEKGQTGPETALVAPGGHSRGGGE